MRKRKMTIECPKDYRRDIKAEIKYYLGLAATAILFDLVLLAAYIHNGM